MSGLLVRHFTTYLRAGFWATILAAGLNGVYWRLSVTPLTYNNILAAATAAVALSAIFLNWRALRNHDTGGGCTGRRVTWLLLLAASLVVASVLIDVSGLRRVWGLP